MPSRRQSQLDKAAGVEVPLLGTTWLRRGPAYWARRAGVLALVLLPLTIVVGFQVLVLDGISADSPAGFIVALVVVVLVIAVMGWVSWGSGRTRTIRRDLNQLRVFETVVAATIVVVLVLAFVNRRAGLAVLLIAFTIGSVALTGPLLAMLVRMLGRELPTERETRIRYGIPAPGSDEPPHPRRDRQVRRGRR